MCTRLCPFDFKAVTKQIVGGRGGGVVQANLLDIVPRRDT
jgi:hypothetical protein